MKTYKNLKKSTKTGLIVSFSFVVIGFIVSVISLCILIESDAFSVSRCAWNVINLALFGFVALYAFIGYKKPHGNMLQVLFLAFGAFIVFEIAMTPAASSVGLTVGNTCYIFSALDLAFVAGRLQKIEKNKWALVLAGILATARLILVKINLPVFVISTVLDDITPMIILSALGFAYTARYEEHKAAGLADTEAN